MSCPSCGFGTTDELCSYHGAAPSAVERDNWAEGNRAICDWLHRGRELIRLSLEERDDYTSAPVDPQGWTA